MKRFASRLAARANLVSAFGARLGFKDFDAFATLSGALAFCFLPGFPSFGGFDGLPGLPGFGGRTGRAGLAGFAGFRTSGALGNPVVLGDCVEALPCGRFKISYFSKAPSSSGTIR